jgi:hypothetical protein
LFSAVVKMDVHCWPSSRKVTVPAEFGSGPPPPPPPAPGPVGFIGLPEPGDDPQATTDAITKAIINVRANLPGDLVGMWGTPAT